MTREARPTLTVWVYDSTLGAAAGQVRLEDLYRRGAVTVVDAAVVTWVPGAHRPRTSRLRIQTDRAAARPVERPDVLGALLRPLVVDEREGAAPLLAAGLEETGLDEAFLAEVRSALAPGTSALLVLSSTADLDEVRPVVERGLARGDVVLLHLVLRAGAVEILWDHARTHHQ